MSALIGEAIEALKSAFQSNNKKELEENLNKASELQQNALDELKTAKAITAGVYDSLNQYITQGQTISNGLASRPGPAPSPPAASASSPAAVVNPPSVAVSSAPPPAPAPASAPLTNSSAPPPASPSPPTAVVNAAPASPPAALRDTSALNNMLTKRTPVPTFPSTTPTLTIKANQPSSLGGYYKSGDNKYKFKIVAISDNTIYYYRINFNNAVDSIISSKISISDWDNQDLDMKYKPDGLNNYGAADYDLDNPGDKIPENAKKAKSFTKRSSNTNSASPPAVAPPNPALIAAATAASASANPKGSIGNFRTDFLQPNTYYLFKENKKNTFIAYKITTITANMINGFIKYPNIEETAFKEKSKIDFLNDIKQKYNSYEISNKPFPAFQMKGGARRTRNRKMNHRRKTGKKVKPSQPFLF